MAKKTKLPRGGNTAAHELNTDLINRPPSRGIRPPDVDIIKAIRVCRARLGHASARLQVSERSLRRWIGEDPNLEAVFAEERSLLVDEAQTVLERILQNERHPRNWDACRFVLERLNKAEFAMHVNHSAKVEVVRPTTPALGERDFTPELWDLDQAHRYQELAQIPPHKLTDSEMQELRALMRIADKSNLIMIEHKADDGA
jgi:hypothetical protein